MSFTIKGSYKALWGSGSLTWHMFRIHPCCCMAVLPFLLFPVTSHVEIHRPHVFIHSTGDRHSGCARHGCWARSHTRSCCVYDLRQCCPRASPSFGIRDKWWCQTNFPSDSISLQFQVACLGGVSLWVLSACLCLLRLSTFSYIY